VLAVLALALILDPLREEPGQVTASEAVPPFGARARIPDVLEVRCTPRGIEVPVASVRPRRDGMHVRVVNVLGRPTRVEVRSSHWSSGLVRVAAGATPLRQPVPPGVLTIGCDIAGHFDQRRVDLVDTNRLYRAPTLACPEKEQRRLENVPVDPSALSLIPAVRRGLASKVTEQVATTEIGPVTGYPSARLGDPTIDPVVQVGPPGAVVAIAHVRGDHGAISPPFTTLVTVDICISALAKPKSGTGPPGSTATTELEPSRGGTPPE
jgi:hypothetical protein